MSEVYNGGPAFPVLEQGGDGRLELAHPGMTLRDYFAAKHMQALTGTALYTEGSLFPHEVAQHAYEMADAMLKAMEA